MLIDCHTLIFRNSLSFFKISGKWECLLGFLCFIYETMFIILIEGIHADSCSLNHCLRIVHGEHSSVFFFCQKLINTLYYDFAMATKFFFREVNAMQVVYHNIITAGSHFLDGAFSESYTLKIFKSLVL